MPLTTVVAPTGNANTDGILTLTKWAVQALTYSFPGSASFYGPGYGAGEPATFGQLNGAQQAAARAAFAQFASVANLTFTEMTETASVHADLRLAQSDRPSTAWAYLPSPAAEGGDSWYNKSSGYYSAPAKGNYANLTFIHELGHALGLDHAHEGPAVPAARDSMEYTVMSYRSYIGASTSTGYTNERWGYAQTLMMYDLQALQHMYGADYTTNSGATTYSWSSTTGEFFINGVGQGAPGGNRIFMTLWDGGGVDTYNFSNYSTGVVVDLRPGAWTITSAGQLAQLHYDGSRAAVGNIANALLFNSDLRSLIENVVGGSGDDRITGNQAANRLAGGNLTFSWGADGALNAFGDFNNDGRMDVVQIERNYTIGIWLSTGSAFSARGQWGSGAVPGDRVGDFNGDGRDDIVELAPSGTAYVWTSTGTGFNGYRVWGSGVRPQDKIGDFNGDGRDDLIQLVDSGSGYVGLSNGNGFDPYSRWAGGFMPSDRIGDFNGDGRDDVIQLLNSGSGYVWLSNGGGFAQYSRWGSGFTAQDRIGDFNGDGRDDVIQLLNGGSGYVWLSAGNGFAPYSRWAGGFTPSDSIGDFNGDGRDDIVQLGANGNAYVWISTGTGFQQYQVWGTGTRPTDRIADVNGDGRDDLVRLDSGGTAFVFLSTGTSFGGATAWGSGVQTGVASGSDTFVFQAGFGNDTIVDFEAGAGVRDVIRFEGGLFASFAAMMASTQDNGAGGTVIRYDANNTVTLLNTSKAALHQDDFAFA